MPLAWWFGFPLEFWMESIACFRRIFVQILLKFYVCFNIIPIKLKTLWFEKPTKLQTIAFAISINFSIYWLQIWNCLKFHRILRSEGFEFNQYVVKAYKLQYYIHIACYELQKKNQSHSLYMFFLLKFFASLCLLICKCSQITYEMKWLVRETESQSF